MNTPPNPAPGARPHHPLLIGAAIAVILFCLAGTAAIMGWIPSSIGGNASTGELSEADRLALASRLHPATTTGPAIPAPAALDPAPAAPAAQALASNYVEPPANYVPPGREPAYSDAPAPVRPREVQTVRRDLQVAQAEPAREPARPRCINCGYVESVREITTRAQGSGVGAAGGAILGGLLGNQVGGGHGRQLATVAGAVGGAVVGNQVEGHMKATRSYEIRVRLDNGKTRTLHQQSAPRWGNGDRVRIVNGALRSVN